VANLLSVVNNLDGLSATATLDAVPNGTFEFTASRTVAITGQTVVATSMGGNQYSLALATGVFASIEVLYWVQFTDESGTSVQTPIWTQYGTNDTLPIQITKYLQGVLVSNKSAIDVRLAAIQPSHGSKPVQQIIAGTGQVIRDTPAIYIAPESMPEEWMVLPLTSKLDPSVKIVLSHFHNGDVSWRDAIMAGAWAIRSILNQSQYADATLPGGTTITNAMCTNVVVVESENGKRYEVSAEISWGCEIGQAIV